MSSAQRRILVDDAGQPWADAAWGFLAHRIGERGDGVDVAHHVVAACGFIDLRSSGDCMHVRLQPGRFGLTALAGALRIIEAHRPRRIVLATECGAEPSVEIFATLADFADRAEQLAVRESPATAPVPWIAVERGLDVLSPTVAAKVRPLVDLWRATRGRLTAEMPRALMSLGLMQRCILVRRAPRSSRLVFAHYGASIAVMRPCEALAAVGRDVDDIPDRPYGAWVARCYAEALAGRRLRLEAVRATIRTSTAATVRARYDRLLVPMRGEGTETYLLSLSMPRSISAVG
jgi:hypothetical protein